VVHSGRLDENVELLSKPYSREALARKIRHVLAKAAQRRLTHPTSLADSSAPAVPALKKQLRVLVCEDDSLTRDSTIDMLRLIGHQAVGAGDARTALSMLVSEPFDILLTDVGLPDMSGVTLAECARSRLSKLEVVFVTGQALDPAVRTAIAAQVLMKPFSLEALVGVLAAVESAVLRGM
jgi:CheY-like chemotaxis protein